MTRPEVLEKAKEQVTGQRTSDYGNPERSLAVIGSSWAWFLNNKKGIDITISAEEASEMMVLFKISRTITGAGKSDNYVDMIGYAACAEEYRDAEN